MRTTRTMRPHHDPLGRQRPASTAVILGLALGALAFVLVGCSGAQCWPTELRRELECPPTHPFRNPLHPELCYAKPQTPVRG